MENKNKIIDKIIVTLISIIPTGMFIGSAISEFFVILTILFWFIRIAITKQNPFPFISKNPLFYPVLLWLISIYIALFLNIKSATPDEIGHDIVLLRFVLLFFIILDVSKNNNIFKPFISGLIFCFALIMFNIVMTKLVGHDIFNIPAYKYFNKMSKAGDITMLFAYMSPIFIGLALFIKNITALKRWLFALLGIIAFGVIVCLEIRTAMISTTIGIAVIVSYFVFKKVSIKVAFLSILIPMVILIIVFFNRNSNYSSRSISSFADRIAIWKASLEIWKEKPIFGVSVFNYSKSYEKNLNKKGFGSSANFMGSFRKLDSDYVPNHAHNVFVEQLSCTGIVGLISLIWLIINLFKIIIRSNKHYILFISIPIVFCVQGLSGWHIYQSLYGSYFFLTISILTAICDNPKEQDYS